ncbi:PrsW family intramembrane metalloprotease [Caloranaerobacter azorensis]|uniref:PrsW family intramembrane metalloprotease n=1 Tax=Caloranaerobacter azorensis TaxID=116090 RepID=UPI0009326FC6|nr:PrsW family glutamic-type intramembrane protease [Caloranaerobacter azorensis]
MKDLLVRLFIIAITPAISIAYAVYLSDRYDREPISLLLKTFIFGALSVIPTIIVERFLASFNFFTGIPSAIYTAFLVAGFTEEFFKREVVLRFVYNSKHFDEKLDGIVYSIFSALGFATVENVMYVVFRFSYNSYVGLYRGILSVPAHAIFAVTMGYYLSISKFTSSLTEKELNLKKSLFIPIITHGIFDFMLMSRILILAVLFIPYLIYIWKNSQIKLNKYIIESGERFSKINKKNNLINKRE